MLNYWWVTRPKRKLNSIPEVLASVVEVSINQTWLGQRNTHLSVEDALEQSGLKRQGDRRDHTGGGGRTYYAWLESLGLIFIHTDGQVKLTLAGEAILEGHSPVDVLTNQIIKYQFPSSFSISRGVDVNRRFKIRPFKFLLTLLLEPHLEGYITQDEIAKIVITEAENESIACYNNIVNRIEKYRNYGDSVLSDDFPILYKSSKSKPNFDAPFAHLLDIANTMINWLEYTQVINRDKQSISVLPEKITYVISLVNQNLPFIDRPEQEDYFQRKYGCTPWKSKDTRNLSETHSITEQLLNEKSIQRAFFSLALKEPIASINSSVIDRIVHNTGISFNITESILHRLYPHGAVNAFMSEYFSMAFRGTEEATAFEKATVEIFKTVFGFKAFHVGPIPLSPDSIIISDEEGYTGIFDNKAYSRYSISNDHHNRMCVNYIPRYQTLTPEASNLPLAFFSYIAGGFIPSIDSQLSLITKKTNIAGSAITVNTFIEMIKNHSSVAYSHKRFKEIFSINRQIHLNDI